MNQVILQARPRSDWWSKIIEATYADEDHVFDPETSLKFSQFLCSLYRFADYHVKICKKYNIRLTKVSDIIAIRHMQLCDIPSYIKLYWSTEYKSNNRWRGCDDICYCRITRNTRTNTLVGLVFESMVGVKLTDVLGLANSLQELVCYNESFKDFIVVELLMETIGVVSGISRISSNLGGISNPTADIPWYHREAEPMSDFMTEVFAAGIPVYLNLIVVEQSHECHDTPVPEDGKASRMLVEDRPYLEQILVKCLGALDRHITDKMDEVDGYGKWNDGIISLVWNTGSTVELVVPIADNWRYNPCDNYSCNDRRIQPEFAPIMQLYHDTSLISTMHTDAILFIRDSGGERSTRVLSHYAPYCDLIDVNDNYNDSFTFESLIYDLNYRFSDITYPLSKWDSPYAVHFSKLYDHIFVGSFHDLRAYGRNTKSRDDDCSICGD